MKRSLGLTARMVLYFVFATLASQGFVVFDQEAGTVTFRIEDIVLAGSGLIGYVGTFVAGRKAKDAGGLT